LKHTSSHTGITHSIWATGRTLNHSKPGPPCSNTGWKTVSLRPYQN